MGYYLTINNSFNKIFILAKKNNKKIIQKKFKIMSRLQFRHYEGVYDTREDALVYISKLTNHELATNLGESLIGEPFTVAYLDENGGKQVLLCIGKEGNVGDGILEPYHIIDSAKLAEDIEEVSGATE